MPSPGSAAVSLSPSGRYAHGALAGARSYRDQASLFQRVHHGGLGGIGDQGACSTITISGASRRNRAVHFLSF